MLSSTAWHSCTSGLCLQRGHGHGSIGFGPLSSPAVAVVVVVVVVATAISLHPRTVVGGRCGCRFGATLRVLKNAENEQWFSIAPSILHVLDHYSIYH